MLQLIKKTQDGKYTIEVYLFVVPGFGMSLMQIDTSLVRAVVCRSAKEAEMARLHNDANVLCLGADFTTTNPSKENM